MLLTIGMIVKNEEKYLERCDTFGDEPDDGIIDSLSGY